MTPNTKSMPTPNAQPPRVGFCLALFTSRTPGAASQLVDQFESYCIRFRENLHWFLDHDHAEWRELDDELLGYARRRLLGGRRRKIGDVVVYAHGAEHDIDADPNFVALSARAEDLDEVYGILEMWHEAQCDATALLKEALEQSTKLQPLSGYGGFGTAPWVDNDVGQDCHHVLFALAQRFQGVEVQDPWFTQNAAKTVLPVVQWLTIVSDDLLRRVGGRKVLDGLPEGIVVHDYGTGVIVQAGPAPSLGDVNKGDRLPLYRAVAKKLAKLRHKDPLPLGFNEPGSLGKEETLKWYRRLEREP